VQLREGALKHKTEVETIVLEHQAEVDAMRAGYESQLSNTRRQVSDLQQRLEDTEGKLADAQVRSALTPP
jgi:vacuolar-type H+-ATPase subunit I/STV1